MKKVLFGLLVIGLLSGCSNDDAEIDINGDNFLIFGHFYGECAGEGCVETFKLTGDGLFEDTIDDYNGQNFDFVELNTEVFEQVKNLAEFFPNPLLNENEPVIGCPDCADGGGLLVQYSENGNVKSWRIDQVKDNVPTYLHEFIDQVNQKIALINP